MNRFQIQALADVGETALPSVPSSTMTLFQLFAVAFVGALFILSLAAVARGWATRREGLAWAVVWLATGLAILLPDLTTIVAKSLGIHRGADLVLYCTAIVMLVGFFMVYARLRRLRRDLTLLTRHLALREAGLTHSTDPPVAPPPAGGGSGP